MNSGYRAVLASVAGKDYRMMSGKASPCISPSKEVTGVTSGVTRMFQCGGTVCVTMCCQKKNMPFELLTVLPARQDVEVNGFNGGVLIDVPLCI